jgi:hypothetical protein
VRIVGSPRKIGTHLIADEHSVNGLRFAKYMIGNHPPRRTVYGRDSSARPFPDDRERMARARQVAEALFAPKPPVTEKPSIDQSARLQRVLEGSPPPRREAIETPVEPEPQTTREIPRSQFARIRALVR